LERRLGEPQSRSGRGGEEKNSQPPPGIETAFMIVLYRGHFFIRKLRTDKFRKRVLPFCSESFVFPSNLVSHNKRRIETEGV
jgi:hypothetical protein